MPKVGDTVKVVKTTGKSATKRHGMDIGIAKGVEIHVRKVAPWGPMELSVRGYELSVRKADAGMIEIG